MWPSGLSLGRHWTPQAWEGPRVHAGQPTSPATSGVPPAPAASLLGPPSRPGAALQPRCRQVTAQVRMQPVPGSGVGEVDRSLFSCPQMPSPVITRLLAQPVSGAQAIRS